MAVMLRSIGIPARLATGFQSGIYNPVSELWLVRASDAHSWVEAWIPGRGWTTFDPDAARSRTRDSLALLTRLALYLDAAETFWQEWVVTYDIARQGTLAGRMEQGAHRLGIRWFDSLAAVARGCGTDTWSRRCARYGVWVVAIPAGAACCCGCWGGALLRRLCAAAAGGARAPRSRPAWPTRRCSISACCNC